MSRFIDLSLPPETGQPVVPGLARTLLNTWNTSEPIPLDLYYENLILVDPVVGQRFQFAGFPLQWVGAGGAPLRAVALLEE